MSDIVIERIQRLTGVQAPEITVKLYETIEDYISNVYPYANITTVPDYMCVSLDFDNHILSACSKDKINLFLLYLIYGKFNNMHPEWLDMLDCYSQHEYCASSEITVSDSLPFPQILYADDNKYNNAKAKLFAEMTEQFGFAKMIEWLETPDLLYYYKDVFGMDCEMHIESSDVSHYEKILRGELTSDEDTNLALWIDDKYRKECRLDVFYSDKGLTKAAITYNESVLGIVKIQNGSALSYVTDYNAWQRRRAVGYARNNPYNKEDFMKKILSYSESEHPKILELGIGTGRIAAPFVQSGYEYYGLEVLDEMADECIVNLGSYENLHITMCDFNYGIPFPDDTFDICIDCRAVTNPSSFLMNEINRVLKNKGVFYDIQDNFEIYEGEHKEHSIIMSVYENAYLDYHNISSRLRKRQNLYGKELPVVPRTLPYPESDYTFPEPDYVFSTDNPFSQCEFEYDFFKNYKDNKYHMAFFRTEPMLEPCCTDFYDAMMKVVPDALDSLTDIHKRKTNARIYINTSDASGETPDSLS